MDDTLKELMRNLGQAINDSLSESDRIGEAIGEIRQAGYDIFLVLEVTIGFNRLDPNTDDDEETIAETRVEAEAGDNKHGEQKPTELPPALKWTPQDQKFFKSLHIRLD